MQHHDPNATGGKKGVSRRFFLKGSSAAVAATTLTGQIAQTRADEPGGKLRAAEPQTITLNVNGKDVQVVAEPRTTLLDVLRDKLNLTGCKHVDDKGADGADTVMIDGKPALAGSKLAVECEGQKITTVELLRNGEEVDEVVAGFVKHDAMQCGFCTPGFVMATRAFLNKNPNATLEEIQKGLGGNICRCGTYAGITQCALEIAKKGGN